jgi:hypothetical protein
MSDARIASFEAFWPYYLGEHARPPTRWLHFLGTNLGLAVVAWSVASAQPLLLPLALLPGYGFAWVSHFLVERNRPATFTYPLWSLLGDLKMLGLMWTGRLWTGAPAHARTEGSLG